MPIGPTPLLIVSCNGCDYLLCDVRRSYMGGLMETMYCIHDNVKKKPIHDWADYTKTPTWCPELKGDK